MEVVFSQKVKKAMKKMHRSGRKDVLHSFEEVVDLFAVYDNNSRMVLNEQFNDHLLTANMRGFRELHLAQDILLVYIVHSENLIELCAIVNHEELKKM